MKITIENYFDHVNEFKKFINTESSLIAAHDFLIKVTSGGTSLDAYHSSDSLKETINIYLDKINKHLAKKGNAGNEDAKLKPIKENHRRASNGNDSKEKEKYSGGAIEKKHTKTLEKMLHDLEMMGKQGKLTDEDRQEKSEIYRELQRRVPASYPSKIFAQELRPETEYESWRIEFRDLKKMTSTQLNDEFQRTTEVENYNGLTKEEKEYQSKILKLINSKSSDQRSTGSNSLTLVERIPEELRFIRRFINLNGKSKTKDELLRFINSLQKAIVEKRIRKTSRYAEQVSFIQGKLIDTFNSMKSKITIELKQDTYESLKKLTGEEKVLASIGFIKRYIGLNGKLGVRQKAKQLLEQINRAVEKGRIPDNDPYSVEIYEIKKNLKTFITGKEAKTLEIETATLNGLEGILGCACQNKTLAQKPTIMNSVDFANLEFDTIGLRGKWYHLIGDPSPNFKGMVSGKPKLGKSTLCIEFAGYLARNHGKVLYVAKEEGLDYTLQEKLKDKDVAHPNLDVASVLPDNLAPYDFIFIDSVTRMGLKPDDLNRLEQAYPTKAFMYVFQTTKDGRFRGANAFQHNVDVVIDVPEKGKAIQMGRFNQGGEMDIFSTGKPPA